MDEFDKRELETKKLFAEMNSKEQLRASVKFIPGFETHSDRLKCYATTVSDDSGSRYAVVLSAFDKDTAMFHAYVSRAFTFKSEFTLWSGNEEIGAGVVCDNRKWAGKL